MPKSSIILKTKLQPPALRQKVLRRDRLLRMINNNIEKKLFLICADAGYGKTTLLSQYCAATRNKYVFYDLDSNDNDFGLFFRYIITGLNQHSEGFGRNIDTLLSQSREVELIVGTFINEFIENFPKEVFLIFDDFHHLQKNRRIIAAIEYLLRHLPNNLHIIIASRTTPPLNLTYYATKQEMLMIGKEHLQFDIKETRLLFGEIYGMEISQEEIDRIAEISQGWATVLHLISQKIVKIGVNHTHETLNNYVSSDEELFEYFAREVFENQPKAIQNFLIKTSILDLLNPAVCNHLLGIRKAGEILKYLETEHVFIQKIGRDIKYNMLFQEFLHRRLLNLLPSREIRKLDDRAAEFYLNKQNFAAAIRHYLKAESYTKAAQLIIDKYEEWEKPADTSVLLHLIEQFPTKILEIHPRLLIKQSQALIRLNMIAEAFRIINHAQRLLRNSPDHNGYSEALGIAGYLDFMMMQPRKALAKTERALKIISPRATSQRADLLLKISSIHRMLGHYDRTKKYLEDALQILRRLNVYELEIEALHRLALFYFSMADYKKAANIFEDIFSRKFKKISPLSLAYMYYSAASVAVNAGELEKAENYIFQAEDIANQFNDRYLPSFLLYLKGATLLYNNEPSAAIEVFKEVMNLSEETRTKMLDLHVQLEMAAAFLLLNRVASAREALRKVEPLMPSASMSPSVDINYLLIRAKIEDAEGNVQAAQTTLKRAIKQAHRIKQDHPLMMCYYALSKTHMMNNDTMSAKKFFTMCLHIAQQREYDAYLVLEGKRDLGLFQMAIENNVMIDYIKLILKRIDSQQALLALSDLNRKQGFFHLYCRLFGRIEIMDQHNNLLSPVWRTRKSRSLFVQLISEKSNIISKSQIIDTLWPGKDLVKATRSLQVEMSSIRDIIRLAAPDIPDNKLIIYHYDNYSLNPRLQIRTDCDDFEDLIKQGKSLEKTSSNEMEQCYYKALETYRGDYCSEIDDPWIAERRNYYRQQVFTISKTLGQRHHKSKKYNEAIILLKKALEFDRYDREVNISLIRCYMAVGNRTDAQKHFDQYRRILKELDLEDEIKDLQEIAAQLS